MNVWYAAFTAVPFFLISFTLPASLYCEEYVHIYTYLTGLILYMNCRFYQTVLRVKRFCTNVERYEVLAGYLSLRRRPVGDRADNVTLDKTV